jgi:hypothetical protein
MSKLFGEESRRIRDNQRKIRIAAFQRIIRPSLNLVRKLLSAKKTPPRLRLIVAEKYALAFSRRKLRDAPVSSYRRSAHIPQWSSDCRHDLR